MTICNQTPDVVKYTNFCDPSKAQLDSDFASYNQVGGNGHGYTFELSQEGNINGLAEVVKTQNNHTFVDDKIVLNNNGELCDPTVMTGGRKNKKSKRNLKRNLKRNKRNLKKNKRNLKKNKKIKRNLKNNKKNKRSKRTLKRTSKRNLKKNKKSKRNLKGGFNASLNNCSNDNLGLDNFYNGENSVYTGDMNQRTFGCRQAEWQPSCV